MGREITDVCVNGNTEWWIVNTSCEYYSRVSKPFENLHEIFETLRQGGLLESIIEKLEKERVISSLSIGENGIFSFSRAIDEALEKSDALCPDGEWSLYDEGVCNAEGCDEPVLVPIYDGSDPSEIFCCYDCM